MASAPTAPAIATAFHIGISTNRRGVALTKIQGPTLLRLSAA